MITIERSRQSWIRLLDQRIERSFDDLPSEVVSLFDNHQNELSSDPYLRIR
jgi:hypothetical protein